MSARFNEGLLIGLAVGLLMRLSASVGNPQRLGPLLNRQSRRLERFMKQVSDDQIAQLNEALTKAADGIRHDMETVMQTVVREAQEIQVALEQANNQTQLDLGPIIARVNGLTTAASEGLAAVAGSVSALVQASTPGDPEPLDIQPIERDPQSILPGEVGNVEDVFKLPEKLLGPLNPVDQVGQPADPLPDEEEDEEPVLAEPAKSDEEPE